ncbi:MAG: WbuC family cupin fold metalloprotein [Proteobacteria bacterium]|nr:WbuC family cupin fold metalloprotein [Pseudomonadota bacterium]
MFSLLKALNAPTGPTTIIGTALVQQAIEASRMSARKRIILPFHKGPEAPLHRMLNAIQPFSYIRPHRHLHPPKPESVIVLQGALLCIVFTSYGAVQEAITLASGTDEFGFDCEPGIFHTFLALHDDTVLFEVKPGPYQANADKDFATWAPPEDSGEAMNFLMSLYLLEKTKKFSPKLF